MTNCGQRRRFRLATRRDRVPFGHASRTSHAILLTDRGRHTGRTGDDPLILAWLAAGLPATEVAKAAGVSERTAGRRLSDPEFAAGIEAARSEILHRAVAKVSVAAVSAADTLVALLRTSERPTVRLAAAKAVFDFGIRLRTEVEFSDRLKLIEQHLGILERDEA